MNINSNSLICETPNKDDTYLNLALMLYDNFNKKVFDATFCTPFAKTSDLIYQAFKQEGRVIKGLLPQKEFGKSNKIVLAFSGGLDSVYQALKLREEGEEVVLFHVKNANAYSNFQEYKAAKAFADKYSFEWVEAYVRASKNETYRKSWPENPSKNEMIYSIILDWMTENDCYKLSAGDDFRLDMARTVPDTNLSDAREITQSFLENFPIEFIPLKNATKVDRLKYLKEKNALDDFYSCVAAGRLVQFLKGKAEKKFNIKLEHWNCGGGCRKCAMHSLILHYYLGVDYPKEYLDKCWDTISIGADNIFFDKSIPLETRIKNLEDY